MVVCDMSMMGVVSLGHGRSSSCQSEFTRVVLWGVSLRSFETATSIASASLLFRNGVRPRCVVSDSRLISPHFSITNLRSSGVQSRGRLNLSMTSGYGTFLLRVNGAPFRSPPASNVKMLVVLHSCGFILYLFHYKYGAIFLSSPDPASTLAPNTRYRLSHILCRSYDADDYLMTLYLIPQLAVSSRSDPKTIGLCQQGTGGTVYVDPPPCPRQVPIEPFHLSETHEGCQRVHQRGILPFSV